MTFFELQPEVDGGLGSETTGDTIARPPQLDHFHYEFDAWPEDSLIEALCTYIVTDALKRRLIEAHASGVAFGHVQLTKSGICEELHPYQKLPPYSWLIIKGRAGEDDFGMSIDNNLVVSSRIMNLLRGFVINNCDINEYTVS